MALRCMWVQYPWFSNGFDDSHLVLFGGHPKPAVISEKGRDSVLITRLAVSGTLSKARRGGKNLS